MLLSLIENLKQTYLILKSLAELLRFDVLPLAVDDVSKSIGDSENIAKFRSKDRFWTTATNETKNHFLGCFDLSSSDSFDGATFEIGHF